MVSWADATLGNTEIAGFALAAGKARPLRSGLRAGSAFGFGAEPPVCGGMTSFSGSVARRAPAAGVGDVARLSTVSTAGARRATLGQGSQGIGTILVAR